MNLLKRVYRSKPVVEGLRRTGLYEFSVVAGSGFSKGSIQRWQDLRQFRDRVRGRFDEPIQVDGSLDVLFVHLLPNTVVAQIEGTLARALAERDAQPGFVLPRKTAWAESHLRALGLREFVHHEDHSPGSSVKMGVGIDELRTIEEVKEIEREGVRVGRHALSQTMTRRREGQLDLSDPEVQESLKENLRESIQATQAARSILDTHDPDLLFVHERGLTPAPELYEVALNQDRQAIHWNFAQRDDALVFRRYDRANRDEHYFTLSDRSWKQVQSETWTTDDARRIQTQLWDSYQEGTWFDRKNLLDDKNIKDPEELADDYNLRDDQPLAVIFSHVLWDATFWYGDNLFDDYATWLVESIQAACKNPRADWIVKMHPDNVWKEEALGDEFVLEDHDEYQLIQDEIGDLPDHVKLMPPDTDTSTATFFEAADYGITVRGTIGLELPCFGIPVLTAGTGRYSGRGFTIDSETQEEYLARLRAIETIPPLDDEQTRRAQQFTEAVFNRRPLPIESFSWQKAPERQVDGILPYDFEINQPDAEALAKAPDMQRFADWVLDSEATDLLLSRDRATPKVRSSSS